MKTAKALWYLQDENNQPTGPYTAERIAEWWRKGRVPGTARCWREGIPDWLPLEQVEPFASRIKRARGAKRKRILRVAIVIGAVAAVIAGGIIAYLVLVEPAEVREAESLIAAGSYKQAVEVLAPFVAENETNHKALYLLALAMVNHYASAEHDESRPFAYAPGPTALILDGALKLCQKAFEGSDRLVKRARSDFAKIPARIPKKAPDALARHLAVARLREKLRLAGPEELGRDLLDAVKERAKYDSRCARDAGPALQIVSWSPSLAQQVLELVLPREDVPVQEVHRVVHMARQWAQTRQAVAQVLPSALLDRADHCAKRGLYAQAEALLAPVPQLDPKLAEEVHIRRLKSIRRRLAAGDAKGAALCLGRVRPESPKLRAQAAGLYLRAAKALRAADARAARQALSKGLSLDPQLAGSEETRVLQVELHPQPDETKLALCRKFLQECPTSRHRASVLKLIVGDAVAAFDRHGRWGRPRARPYLEAATAAAEELMQKHASTPKLDAAVFELARRLETDKQYGRAKRLLTAARKAVPSSALGPEIARKMVELGPRIYGTLPPELYPLADRVEETLNIVTVTSPTALHTLKAGPQAAHVLQMAKECTASKFSSEDAGLLRKWVEEGGVLWASNDVLKLFGIAFRRGWGNRSYECSPRVPPAKCPILTACKRVAVRRRGEAHSLAHKRVIPLLTVTEGRKSWDSWSLVSYGKGWVSNVLGVDVHKYDGGRFWLNFRLFCLNAKIPGAPQVSSRAWADERSATSSPRAAS